MPNKGGLLNVGGATPNYDLGGQEDLEADIRRTARFVKKKKKQRSASADAVKIYENRMF